MGDNHDSENVGRGVARRAGNGLPSWLAESTPNEFVVSISKVQISFVPSYHIWNI